MTSGWQWGENVIIADADYIDFVAFDLTVNFERMIGRHIAKADMAQWVTCVALDGGCKADDGKAATDVVLVHDNRNSEMNNFNPSAYGDGSRPEDLADADVLGGKAFRDAMGEFSFHAVGSIKRSEAMTTLDIIHDTLAALADESGVKRIMLVADTEREETLPALLPVLRHLDRECPEKRVTVFAMQPLAGLPCRSEILGYSLMAALGIRADEIKEE